MTNSILLTVFNRPQRMLLNTLEALSRNNLKNCEIIIGDDGSTTHYGDVVAWCAVNNVDVTWVYIDPLDYPADTFRIPHADGGFINNPAFAWNRVVEASSGDRLIFLSSDCMVPKHGVDRAKRCGEFYWIANTLDQNRSMWLVDNIDPKPWPFFASVKRDHYEAIGGVDEGYLCGIAWEDNDFSARLGLRTKHIIFDSGVIVVHQFHCALDPDLKAKGYKAAARYTLEKWSGGEPWHTNESSDPMDKGFTTDGVLRRCNLAIKDGFSPPKGNTSLAG